MKGSTECAKLLLDKGADVNAKFKDEEVVRPTIKT